MYILKTAADIKYLKMNPNFGPYHCFKRLKGFTDYNDKTNYNPLFFAVHNGELELTHSLLKEFSLNEKLSGRKIIHIAAARGHEQIVCLLKEREVEISEGDIDGNTPLHLAMKENHFDLVNLLLTDLTVNLQNLKRETPLHIATQMNNFRFVELLLKNGAEVNLPDAEGKTPLHISTEKINPNLEIIMILLSHGSSVDATCEKGYTPLHYVTTSGNVKITEVLIDQGASFTVKNMNNMDPLCLAIQKNKIEMAKYILGKRTHANFINIGNMMPLHYAAQAGNEEIVKMLVTEGDADTINASGEELKTPLHFSAANGHINIVKYLIESGALIDVKTKDLNTPLHLSAAAGHLEIVSELLNRRGVQIDPRNAEKCTPLYLAVRAGQKEVVSLLFNRGSCVDLGLSLFSSRGHPIRNLIQPKVSAFHIAAENGDLEIVKMFLKNGIEVDLWSIHKKTALHIAASFGHTQLVEELVKAGANIDARTIWFWETPLHLAAASGRSETVKYLLNLGANVEVTTRKTNCTPLLLALNREKDDELIKFKKNRGRSDNSPKKVIISPFRFEQYHKITEMLLMKGASPTSKDCYQNSPLHYALQIMVYKETQVECASNSLEEDNTFKRRNDLLPENPEQTEFRPEIVRCLLNYGAQVDCEPYSILLHCSALTDVLIEYDIKKYYDYAKALELACDRQNYNVILAIAELISDDNIIEKLLLRLTFSISVMSSCRNNVIKLLILILVKQMSTSKTENVVQSKKLTFLEKKPLCEWYTQCVLEVINMRQMKIHHQNKITFYEILTKPDVSELACYLRNADIMKMLDSGICKKFEAYAPLLERNIEKGKQRRDLIDSCIEHFVSLIQLNFKIQLPDLITHKIFEYLSVIDFRKFAATIPRKY